MMSGWKPRAVLSVLIGLTLLVACHASRGNRLAQHRWWSRLGPVIPHETFPADCNLCHLGDSWNELGENFSFDHAARTGVALEGAHVRAQCLRCHNDRGPVALFAAKGCAGCHEDVHQGALGQNCRDCHRQNVWSPFGQVEAHNRTRFPLVGAHSEISCRRCHVGAMVGRFAPTDTTCVTCHRADLLRATNPNHVNLGLTKRCDRCHRPTVWSAAVKR